MDPGHARGIPLHPGALFDADYEDCPFQTCMRDGEIANLDATRDLTDADVVHVTWEVTDPTTWGLGANAFQSSQVVILFQGRQCSSGCRTGPDGEVVPMMGPSRNFSRCSLYCRGIRPVEALPPTGRGAIGIFLSVA